VRGLASASVWARWKWGESVLHQAWLRPPLRTPLPQRLCNGGKDVSAEVASDEGKESKGGAKKVLSQRRN
jgi:hypothetical protein